jgi:acetylornithine deacetylase/succinyl-diaminopimelate desuccinylase-like protein
MVGLERGRHSVTAALTLSTLLAAAGGGAQEPPPAQRLGLDLLRELVGTDTTHEHGSTTKAAEAMARRLRDAGFPPADVQVIGPAGSPNANLVARLRGRGRARPILLLAHLDVVEARKEDWSFDPFTLTEKDGYFYGRGVYDIKDGAAILIATLVRFEREGFVPDGDLVLALTAGEEAGGDYNGVEWLLKEHRDLVDASYCLNMDAGDPQIQKGKRVARTVQASEKVVQSFLLEATSPGGHSSLPTRDNPIYRLAAGLERLAGHDFPVRMNEVTRAYFERMAGLVGDAAVAGDLRAVARATPDAAAAQRLSGSAFYNTQMRTTCVATLIEGGHAENALPQRARATVNCRMLPDEVPADVEATVRRVVADERIKVSVSTAAQPGPASPLTPAVMGAVERTTAALWPGVPVVPVMETGATDGKFLRAAGVPTYGVSGVFIDVDDNRAHGKDERIGVKDFYDGLDYIDALLRALTHGDERRQEAGGRARAAARMASFIAALTRTSNTLQRSEQLVAGRQRSALTSRFSLRDEKRPPVTPAVGSPFPGVFHRVTRSTNMSMKRFQSRSYCTTALRAPSAPGQISFPPSDVP